MKLGKFFRIILLDHLLIFISYWLVVEFRGQAFVPVLERSYVWLLGLIGSHLFIAFLFDKYNFAGRTSLKKQLLPILYTNLTFTVVAGLVIISLTGFPRLTFLYTIILYNALEMIITFIISQFIEAKKQGFMYERDDDSLPDSEEDPPLIPRMINGFHTVRGQAIRDTIVQEAGEGIFDFLKKLVSLTCASTAVMSSGNRINVLSLSKADLQTLVNLKRVNDIRYINKFFESVNGVLPNNGLFVGCGETQEFRKKRFLRRFTPLFGFILYCFDFLINRILPKVNVTKKIYFNITKGKNRVISKAEILGRLYSCGFKVRHEAEVDGLFFFVAQKIREPYFDMSPTYGPLISLRRVGKGGEMIRVYKMRSMHPYSEYLQHYIYECNQLNENGKFRNDCRISTLGRIMRALWIDELPMLANWFKGELKLVGVRPLSEHYFKLYSPDLQQRRIHFKPGLVPPFYADMPKTLDEIMASEHRYLDAYEKSPFLTDWRYFWRAFYNIVFRSARSA